MTSSSGNLNITYTGEKNPLFNLAFKTGLLTIITLGIYRFWQKTRIRKYVWSSVNVDGDTFEYTGTGLEKFLGFLVAIVFLAIYVGIIQMVLFFFGMSVVVDPESATQAEMIGSIAALYITIFAVLPFFLYALYRARRYKMARTRFRGIRCGMEQGAWGFVWRALGYGLLNIFTLFLLSPLSTFKLEKYMADRSFYGSTRFAQHGKWTSLYSAMKHIFIAIAVMILGGIVLGLGMPNENVGLLALGGIALFVGYIWFFVGAIYYQVKSFAYLTSNKTLGEDISFRATPSTGEVIKTYILGALLVGLVVGLAFAVLAAVVAGLVQAMADGGSGAILFGLLAAVGYLVVLALAQALSLIWITQPIIAHYITHIEVVNPEALNAVAQREAETGVDAEGFADALDIGGAI